MYIAPIVDDIREIERREATSREYALGELEKEIRKYTLRTYACIGAAVLSFSAMIGTALYYVTGKENKSPAGLVAVILAGATIRGISLGAGKISAIKADAFDLAKEQRDASRKTPSKLG